MPPLLILLTVAMLFSTDCSTVMAFKVCPNCGRNLVPYPLSTGPDCGDPWYKVRCNEGKLWFDAFNGSSYEISSINPMTQTLVIHPPGFAEKKCVAADYATQGIRLDENLPFNITSANTVMIMNCSVAVLQEYIALNCSSTSVCHEYIRANPEANANCGALPFCCWYATGGTMHEYRIRVRPERCSAYQSFVNLNMSSPVSEWPTPGLEIQWLPPREPECKLPVDCNGLANSICLPDPENAGQRRCLCKPGFQWDSIHGICQGAAFAAGAIIIGLIVTIVVVLKQRKHCEREAEVSLTKAHRDLLSSNSGKLAKFFTIKEIAKATKNFSKDNLLGSGGFGEVFKGVLDDGTRVAVKRAKLGNANGIEQIINETSTKVTLSWHCRLRIAYQTAQGLAYLHSSVVPPIYHRDVKSSNILLDENLDAKVSDFGISRLGFCDASHVTTCAQGTLGYLDPEYYLNFQLTEKSDVYSFGVVLLELLTSKKAIDFNREEEDVNLVVFARKNLKEERFMDVIDPCLKQAAGKIELETMKAVGFLAESCLNERRQNRPSMKSVEKEIESIMSVVTSEVFEG
ncbi:hypothetical protein V6N12_035936 [Hibiscus sabdariffa]|uniref:Protein kinase domain-containing protein n=1 Tax=Hibiscus sabdariffa TaxID=183260 RepID=A0ABR2EP65_9ROSI